MMAISVECPSCRTGLKVPDGLAGKKARCPKCSNIMLIPGIGAASQIETANVPSALPLDSRPARGPGFFGDIFGPAVGSFFAHLGPAILGFWMFWAAFPVYACFVLGLPALVGFLRFQSRAMGGSRTGFKEFLVPDVIQIVYRDGFWKGLWTSVKLMAHYYIFFAVELLAMAAVVGIAFIPFTSVGLSLVKITSEEWVLPVLLAPAILFGAIVFFLWAVDSFTCLYLLAKETPERYDFALFCDHFKRAWELIWNNKAKFLLLIMCEVVLTAAIVGLAWLLAYVAEEYAGDLSSLLIGAVLMLGVFAVPFLVYFIVFFLHRVVGPAETGEIPDTTTS